MCRGYLCCFALWKWYEKFCSSCGTSRRKKTLIGIKNPKNYTISFFWVSWLIWHMVIWRYFGIGKGVVWKYNPVTFNHKLKIVKPFSVAGSTNRYVATSQNFNFEKHFYEWAWVSIIYFNFKCYITASNFRKTNQRPLMSKGDKCLQKLPKNQFFVIWWYIDQAIEPNNFL